ncbi:MAG: hypothetical protein JSR68_08440 [Proteobacteria bacterium]|nr:hypothetical protein [Pseudomonadota bacterium]
MTKTHDRLQLQVNTSGAWKTVLRYNAASRRDDGRARKAALLLNRSDPASGWRIATDEPLPRVLHRLDADTHGAWRVEPA